MPVYDFECSCGERSDDVFVHKCNSAVKCKSCSKRMKRLYPIRSNFYPKCFPAEGIYLEHVSPEGKTFYSEKEMRAWEKSTGQELGALL
jgi:predicted nucleic acid-binding Zn ribbon protein